MAHSRQHDFFHWLLCKGEPKPACAFRQRWRWWASTRDLHRGHKRRLALAPPSQLLPRMGTSLLWTSLLTLPFAVAYVHEMGFICRYPPEYTERSELEMLSHLIPMYQLKSNGEAPTSMEALRTAGLLRRVKVNPWGFTYFIGYDRGGNPQICSFNPERKRPVHCSSN